MPEGLRELMEQYVDNLWWFYADEEFKKTLLLLGAYKQLFTLLLWWKFKSW
jgi:hypothetical protein